MKKLCRIRLLRVIALAFALGGGSLLAAGCENGEMEEAVEELEDEAEDAADEVEDEVDDRT